MKYTALVYKFISPFLRKSVYVLLFTMLAGCQLVDIEFESAITDEVGYFEYLASSEGSDTRTSLSGLNVIWDEGDAVTIYQGTSELSEGKVFSVKSGCGGSSSTTLVCQSALSGDYSAQGGVDVAVYGSLTKNFDISGSTVMAYFNLDSLRSYREGSFGPGDLPMMAVSESGTGALSFKNLFGALEVKISGDGTVVRRLVVRGNGNESLTGPRSVLWAEGAPYFMPGVSSTSGKRVVMDCGDGVTLSKDTPTVFYVTLPPVQFNSGITLEIETADGSFVKSSSVSLKIERNKIQRFDTIILSGWEDEFATYATKYKFVEQSHSSKTPMGTHFENFSAATAKQIAWLADPANEPYRFIMRNRADTSWTLVQKTVNLAPFGRPCPADVVQHNIGNCVCLSVFAALSQSYPGFIEKIITRNQDGTFTVKMYDAMGNPLDVCITSKFFTGKTGGTPGVTGHNGVLTWSSVMEKALMKYESCFGFDYVDGIDPLPALAPFVGNGTSHKFAIGKVPQADMKHVVEVCQKSGHIMTGGFRTAGMLIGTAKTVTLHEYACLLCPDPEYLFTMRNPWGFCNGGTKRGDGCMDIYWDDELFPNNIYLRILDPGEAAPYFVGGDKLQPYQKPF